MKLPLLTLLLCAVAAGSAPAALESSAAQESRDALEARPDLDAGAELFRTCGVCHGTSGGGTPDGKVPRISGQHFSVLVKQLVDFRHARRVDPLMQYASDRHLLKGAQDIADVAAYVSEIETLPEDGVSVGSGEYLSRGSEVYLRVCAACHGNKGDGSAQRQIPRVAGQNYKYLVAQIQDGIAGRRLNFSADHVALLKGLTHEDILGVADHLARIPRRIDRLLPQHLAAN